MVVITVAGFIVCGRGLQGGLERGRQMDDERPARIDLVLVVHSFTLSGAGEGLAFYLLPDGPAPPGRAWATSSRRP